MLSEGWVIQRKDCGNDNGLKDYDACGKEADSCLGGVRGFSRNVKNQIFVFQSNFNVNYINCMVLLLLRGMRACLFVRSILAFRTYFKDLTITRSIFRCLDLS